MGGAGGSTQYSGPRKGRVEWARLPSGVILGPMQHHFDDRLSQARVTLLARRAQLLDRIRRVHADLARERDPLPKDSDDAAIAVENDEVLGAIEATANLELQHIAHALKRIDTGAYGTCETCGADIGDSRLEIVPYATKCGRCEPAG
jgi:DnaK suppressor protein